MKFKNQEAVMIYRLTKLADAKAALERHFRMIEKAKGYPTKTRLLRQKIVWAIRRLEEEGVYFKNRG